MDKLQQIAAFFAEHREIISNYFMKAAGEVGKAGLGEVGKEIGEMATGQLRKVIPRLLSKPTVRDAVLNAPRNINEATQHILEAIKLVAAIEPQVFNPSPLATNLHEYLLTLRNRVSRFTYPGVPNFPYGVDIALDNVYVEQKITDRLWNRVVTLKYYNDMARSVYLQDLAGTGKSTALWRFLDILVQHNSSGNISRLPVYIHASDLMGVEKPILNNLVRRLQEIYLLSDDVAREVVDYFQGGKAAFLVDALDEISPSDRSQVVSMIEEIMFLRRNQLIITSRPLQNFPLNISTATINRFTVHDAFRLISKWQRLFRHHKIIDTKADDLLTTLREVVERVFYGTNDIRKAVIETPLFLTFLIFYTVSPAARDASKPFRIIDSKTMLLSRIIEFVIPYWESQKGHVDLISPIENQEALSVLYYVAFLTKKTPSLTWGAVITALDQAQDTLQMEAQSARQYFKHWVGANVIVPSIGTSVINFWHEEIKDFCAARYLFQQYQKGLLSESAIDNYFRREEWRSVSRYFDNMVRMNKA